MSVLEQAAIGKRDAQRILRAANISHSVNVVYKLLKINERFTPYIQNQERYGEIFVQAIGLWVTEATRQEQIYIFHQATDRAYGSPMTLSRDQLALRQFTVRYYNPLSQPITIEAMGLPDEEGGTIKQVSPGGLVDIPIGYTRGGKISTVKGIAPQLLPIPKSAPDTNLDLLPQTYAEWVMYYNYTGSNCCKSQLLWSDRYQSLICNNCRKYISCLA